MRKTIIIFILSVGSLTLSAQTKTDTTDKQESRLIGGAAPILGGLTLLLAMGVAYRIKKYQRPAVALEKTNPAIPKISYSTIQIPAKPAKIGLILTDQPSMAMRRSIKVS